MRCCLPILLLSACAAEPEVERSLYAGDGRDRLCIDGDRAGFITYGDGDANCSATGTLTKDEAIWTLAPRGDEDCRIPLSLVDGRLSIGPGHPSCAYYCGPGAAFASRSLGKIPGDPRQATDFGGDPLC